MAHPTDTQVGVYKWNTGSLGWEKDTIDEEGYTEVFSYNVAKDVEYIGYADPGSSKASALWRIKKISYNGDANITDIQYAGGSTDFNKVWNSRTGYSYS